MRNPKKATTMQTQTCWDRAAEKSSEGRTRRCWRCSAKGRSQPRYCITCGVPLSSVVLIVSRSCHYDWGEWAHMSHSILLDTFTFFRAQSFMVSVCRYYGEKTKQEKRDDSQSHNAATEEEVAGGIVASRQYSGPDCWLHCWLDSFLLRVVFAQYYIDSDRLL